MITVEALLKKRSDLLEAYELAEEKQDTLLMELLSKEIAEIQLIIDTEFF